MPNQPSTVFHYCSNNSFISILKNKELWLSFLDLSNDYFEGKWIRKIFIDLCGGSQLKPWHIDESVKHLDVLIERIKAAGFCMSAGSDVLSQWRAYADEARGVAVGFSTDYLSRLCTTVRNEQCSLRLEEVHYDIKRQEECIEPIVKQLQRQAAEIPELPPHNALTADPRVVRQTRAAAINRLTDPVTDLYRHLYTLKNPAFAEEREWRIIGIIPIFGVEHGALRQCDFRAVSGRIVPFKRIDILDLGVPSIECVVLGPRNQTPQEVVEALLAEYGFRNTRIMKSDASYR